MNTCSVETWLKLGKKSSNKASAGWYLCTGQQGQCPMHIVSEILRSHPHHEVHFFLLGIMLKSLRKVRHSHSAEGVSGEIQIHVRGEANEHFKFSAAKVACALREAAMEKKAASVSAGRCTPLWIWSNDLTLASCVSPIRSFCEEGEKRNAGQIRERCTSQEKDKTGTGSPCTWRKPREFRNTWRDPPPKHLGVIVKPTLYILTQCCDVISQFLENNF